MHSVTFRHMTEQPHDRLKATRLALGYRSAAAFANQNNLPEPTYRSHETGVRNLTIQAAKNYAPALKVDWRWLMFGDEGEGVPKNAGRQNTSGVTQIKVIGAVQAGTWRNALQWDEDEQYSVEAPVPETLRGLRVFGLEVRGPSMNKVYPEGSILLCVSPAESHITPKVGHRVIAIRKDHDEVEATVKELRADGDGKFWLWPQSDHPAHQAPIPLEGTEEVEIQGLVVSSFRHELADIRS